MIKFSINIIKNLFLKYKEKHYLKNIDDFSKLTIVSNLPNLGRGVEALFPIKAGTLIGIYPGKYCSIQEFLQKEEFVAKSVKSSFLFSENIVIDPTDIFGFLPENPNLRIAFINEPPKGLKANVLPLASTSHIWYLTIEDIEIGSQFFTYYGHSYKRDYQTDNQIYITKNLNENNLKILNYSKHQYPWLKMDIEKILALY